MSQDNDPANPTADKPVTRRRVLSTLGPVLGAGIYAEWDPAPAPGEEKENQTDSDHDVGPTGGQWPAAYDDDNSGYDDLAPAPNEETETTGEAYESVEEPETTDEPEPSETETTPSENRSSSEPVTGTVIDLRDEGLQPGDRIDRYLDRHMGKNTTVVFPAAEYEWRGGGFPDAFDHTILRAEGGQATFHIPKGLNSTANVRVIGGGEQSSWIQNITFRGKKGKGSFFRPWSTDRDSSVVFDSVKMPDGGTRGPASNAYFVPRRHTGTIEFRDCRVEGFTDNGIYASAPGRKGRPHNNGNVKVIGGFYRNNNIANVRVGGRGSVIRGVTSIHDRKAISTSKHRYKVNQRGFWAKDMARSTVIEDCKLVQSIDSGYAIRLGGGHGGEKSSGVVQNCRIENNIDQPPIMVKAGDWRGSRNRFSGSGEQRPKGLD
jgi:hypothetical protein